MSICCRLLTPNVNLLTVDINLVILRWLFLEMQKNCLYWYLVQVKFWDMNVKFIFALLRMTWKYFIFHQLQMLNLKYWANILNIFGTGHAQERECINETFKQGTREREKLANRCASVYPQFTMLYNFDKILNLRMPYSLIKKW